MVKAKVLELINSKSLALFCGAGISYNSGIPTVRPLIEYLFKKLGATDEHVSIYLNSNFPFEATVEAIAQDTLIKDFLEVFDHVSPNMNHSLIAQLAKAGYLKMIFTTNFDRNIEVALENNGLVRGNDFVVLFVKEHFEEFNLKTDKVMVFKLHGSMEFMPSIIATISGLSNQANKSLIEKMLKLLFDSHRQKHILFWGYSFSDHFDINPILNSIEDSTLQVYSIEHDYKRIHEEIKNTNRKSLFKSLNSVEELHCNSDIVIKEVTEHFFNASSNPKIDFDWKKIVDKWYHGEVHNSRRYNHGLIILMHIFFSSGHTEIAKHYTDRAFAEFDQFTPFQQMELHNCLAKYYVLEGGNESKAHAAEQFEKDLIIANQIENEYEASIISGNLGLIYIDSKPTKAESLLEATVRYFDDRLKENAHPFQITSKRHYCGYKYNLAVCYKRNSKIKDAIETYQEVMEFAKTNGYLEVLELSAYGLGLIFLDQRYFHKAFDNFLQSYTVAKQMSFRHTIIKDFEEAFACLFIFKGPIEAEKFFNDEIETLKRISNYKLTLRDLVNRKIRISH
jgi:tetratricopeptide (TPR) repeat protein